MRLLVPFTFAFVLCSGAPLIAEDLPPEENPGPPGGELVCDEPDLASLLIDEIIDNTGCSCDENAEDADEFEKCLRKKIKNGKVVSLQKALLRAKVVDRDFKGDLRSAVDDLVQECEASLVGDEPDDDDDMVEPDPDEIE